MEGGQQKSPWRFDKVSLNLSAFPPSTHTERIPTPPDSFLVLHTDFFWLRPSPTALGAARRGLSAARASLSTSSHGAGPPRQQFDFKFVACETPSARRQAEWVACARGGCGWWWACLMLVIWAMLDAPFCGRRALCTAMRAPERLRESPLAATVIAPHQL